VDSVAVYTESGMLMSPAESTTLDVARVGAGAVRVMDMMGTSKFQEPDGMSGSVSTGIEPVVGSYQRTVTH
jgi:hypothetical protein